MEWIGQYKLDRLTANQQKRRGNLNENFNGCVWKLVLTVITGDGEARWPVGLGGSPPSPVWEDVALELGFAPLLPAPHVPFLLLKVPPSFPSTPSFIGFPHKSCSDVCLGPPSFLIDVALSSFVVSQNKLPKGAVPSLVAFFACFFKACVFACVHSLIYCHFTHYCLVCPPSFIHADGQT